MQVLYALKQEGAISSMVMGYFSIPSETPLPMAEMMWFKSGGYCVLYMQSGGDSVWLIGDVFLQNYYTIYNIDAQTISFAPAIKSSYSAAVVIIASFAMIFAV